MKEDIKKLALQITKDLSAQGKLIEGGFAGFRLMAMHKDSPQIQVDEMRMAFFAGAAHLFSCIMAVLDPDEDPTDNDMDRLALIHKELDDFICAFEEKHFSHGFKEQT